MVYFNFNYKFHKIFNKFNLSNGLLYLYLTAKITLY